MKQNPQNLGFENPLTMSIYEFPRYSTITNNPIPMIIILENDRSTCLFLEFLLDTIAF